MDRTSVRDINGRQIKQSGFVFETCHGGTGGVITGRVEILVVVMSVTSPQSSPCTGTVGKKNRRIQSPADTNLSRVPALQRKGRTWAPTRLTTRFPSSESEGANSTQKIRRKGSCPVKRRQATQTRRPDGYTHDNRKIKVLSTVLVRSRGR